MHGPGGRCCRAEAGTHQSRKTRSQLHDGHAVIKAGKRTPPSPPFDLETERAPWQGRGRETLFLQPQILPQRC